jgi:hypothetical protein
MQPLLRQQGLYPWGYVLMQPPSSAGASATERVSCGLIHLGGGDVVLTAAISKFDFRSRLEGARKPFALFEPDTLPAPL